MIGDDVAGNSVELGGETLIVLQRADPVVNLQESLLKQIIGDVLIINPPPNEAAQGSPEVFQICCVDSATYTVTSAVVGSPQQFGSLCPGAGLQSDGSKHPVVGPDD